MGGGKREVQADNPSRAVRSQAHIAAPDPRRGARAGHEDQGQGQAGERVPDQTLPRQDCTPCTDCGCSSVGSSSQAGKGLPPRARDKAQGGGDPWRGGSRLLSLLHGLYGTVCWRVRGREDHQSRAAPPGPWCSPHEQRNRIFVPAPRRPAPRLRAAAQFSRVVGLGWKIPASLGAHPPPHPFRCEAPGGSAGRRQGRPRGPRQEGPPRGGQWQARAAPRGAHRPAPLPHRGATAGSGRSDACRDDGPWPPHGHQCGQAGDRPVLWWARPR
mmetsp:Transcript_2385/g.8298  ORF Transcript_2385/g.8298 Transcript_2385/m.8298 type:complete len:271 (+) Transcript_2385:180-992(+)